MTINRNNFEAYLLDYLEGNLDPLLTADLMAFLAENPEFEKYIPDYDTRISLSDTQSIHQKSQLKKGFHGPSGSNCREISMSFALPPAKDLLVENDVTRLSDYISLHPEKQRDLDLFRKAKLQPDMTVRYSGKNQLKKKQGSVNLRYLYYALGIAASVALLFLLVLRKPAGSVYTETIPVNSGKMENAVRQPDALPSPSKTSSLQGLHGTSKISQRGTRRTPGEDPVARHCRSWQDSNLFRTRQVLSSVQPPPVSDHLAKTAVDQSGSGYRTGYIPAIHLQIPG